MEYMIGLQAECVRVYNILLTSRHEKGPPTDIGRPQLDTDHSHPSSIDVNNKWSYTSTASVYDCMVRKETTLRSFYNIILMRQII
jgi:hypothetical protein